MPNLLVIAHAPLASALRQVAEHTFPDCAPTLTVLDVDPGMCADDVEAAARALMDATRSTDWLVLTDVFGATPSNGALRLAGEQVQVLSGVSVPMLWRTLCYAGQKPLTELARRAMQGAVSGIVATPPLPPDE
ncbi:MULTISPECIES: PTS sugar transporter subunit IIA [Roseateles]|uniref:PTS fructose transporter subunit IIA n=1 Tax=Pelomonas caseinilytica TaxID=2906763 RepID=A0ABS8XL32_9BURK|nr:MULTISPECIES: PTS fructose transporter subunit IIA [unclassified Roseateles]MCE4539637.1 PTS fructose transporter subunit IIA [Pelomonas sp. P7]HEV6964872.1 PTS fructose transporter subunit IIA [Roseateles sp.]